MGQRYILFLVSGEVTVRPNIRVSAHPVPSTPKDAPEVYPCGGDGVARSTARASGSRADDSRFQPPVRIDELIALLSPANHNDYLRTEFTRNT